MSDMASPAQTASASETARWVKRAADSVHHPLTRTLLVLTLTTGVIDAASYLGLGRVFAANMTGNIVLLGFGIAGAAGLPVVAPLVSLGSFLVGAGAGGVLAKRLGDRHPVHVARALAIEVSLIGVAAVFAAVVAIRPDALSGDIVIALLAFAMGVRNATVRRIGVPDLTTTVLTMTLTALASDSRIAGGSGKGQARRIAAVLAMFSGALAGALLLKTSLVLPLAVAAGLALATWLIYVPAARDAVSRSGTPT
jgi:uncharacterized membrane protein YoaK (UPF0700 family)